MFDRFWPEGSSSETTTLGTSAMARNRRATVSIPVAIPQKKLGRGEWVREFAAQRGWPFTTCNLMFEGTTDIEYLGAANDLYVRAHGLHLLGGDLAAFAVGQRDQGGTDNLVQRLQTLKSMMLDDPSDINGEPFRVLAVVDYDYDGKRALYTLTKGVGLREYEDVIVLRHKLPRVTQDPYDLRKRVEEANACWPGLDCEIEDFVHESVLQAFAADFPNACSGQPVQRDGAHHYNWLGHMKPKLAAYVREYAELRDLEQLVELLKFLRFLLRLPPDGVEAKRSRSSGDSIECE